MNTKITNNELFNIVSNMDRIHDTLSVVHLHTKNGSNYFRLNIDDFLGTIPTNDGIYKYGVTVDCDDIYIHTNWEF